MNARAVHANAPVKFMNIPNFGIVIARKPVIRTISVLIMVLLLLSILGNFLKHSVFSVISIAGITCIGNDPKRPRQYRSCTDEVRLS